MDLNLEEITDIDMRFNEANDRFDVNYSRRAVGLSKQISRLIGIDVLFRYHIAWLAYLLGFGDKSMLTNSDTQFNSFSIADRRLFTDIIALMSPDDQTPITHLAAYKRTAVEEAFKKLHEERKLVYSPERFQYALERI